MNARREIIDSSHGDILISIHQNAFPRPGVWGAQVFYYNSSKEGVNLANIIQNRLRENINPENKREAKANTDYYILKQTSIPAVIVECGFLSNPQEEALLNTEEYREKIAWSIYEGITEYFESQEK